MALSEQLKERQEMENKLQRIAKTMDYMERAKREEEAPLIQQAFEQRLEEEKIIHELEQLKEIEPSKQHHAGDIQEKNGPARLLDNKAVLDANKFKFSGIDPDLEEKLDRMFSGVVATSTHAFTTSGHGLESTPEDLETDQASGYGEGPNLNQKELESTCQSKRPRVEKRKNEEDALFRSQIIKLVDACTIQADTSHDTSIDNFIRVLETNPEVYGDKPLYLNSLMLLEDPTRRQIFMAMHPDYRVYYLRSYMDNKDN